MGWSAIVHRPLPVTKDDLNVILDTATKVAERDHPTILHFHAAGKECIVDPDAWPYCMNVDEVGCMTPIERKPEPTTETESGA